jgi:SAM-dependent methyltransferase
MWEERYKASADYLFGTAPAAVLSDNPWLAIPGQSVLCVADGEGRNAVYLAGRGMQVTAFDVSATATARAQQLADQAGVAVQTHQAAWEDWDWTRTYDVIVGIFIQYAQPDARARQFADMARSLRPDGRLILHGYRPEQVGRGTGGPPDVAQMYTEAMLKQAFDGWVIERCASYERDQQAGSGHVGRAALIDFIARKPAASPPV